MSSQKIILIAGPTASGKSALAMEIARRDKGVIINTDAMQIYDGLPILTAQPTAREKDEIPHELYAVLNPYERSSAGKWHTLALAAIDKTFTAGRTPILVGGTGLYFRALLGGLADIPDIPEAVRLQAQKLYERFGEESFRRELAKLDPESSSRIARNDRQRLVRAYEVVTYTGMALGIWQKQTPEQKVAYLVERHLRMPAREELYAACDIRFLNMIERGAVKEVETFMLRNLDSQLPAMKTLGLREIASYLRGELKLDEAITKAQQATRNYAKRQVTWFKNQWQNLG